MPDTRKAREYNTIDYADTEASQMPENFDTTVPYLDVNSKSVQRKTMPGLDTDKVSYPRVRPTAADPAAGPR